MSVIINYAKKDYVAKISELDTYKLRLQNHLNNMENYRSQIDQFWESDDARKTLDLLQLMISRTRHTMAEVEDNLIFYRNIVEKLTGVGSTNDSILDTALGALKLL